MSPDVPRIKVNTAVPVFLWKLWVLLGDNNNHKYIRWSENGDSFVVVDVPKFSKKLLPQYFKHSNFASFIRQLNLYGFRKVIDVQQGITNATENDRYEFQHSYFKRGRQDLIERIRRKLSQNSKKLKDDDIQNTCGHGQLLADSHHEIKSQLCYLRDQNERIWTEVLALREQHERQSKVLDRMINFFASVFRPYNGGISNSLLNTLLQDNNQSSNFSHATNTLNHILTNNNEVGSNINTTNNLVTFNGVLNALNDYNPANSAMAVLPFSSSNFNQSFGENYQLDESFCMTNNSRNSFNEIPSSSAASLNSSYPLFTNEKNTINFNSNENETSGNNFQIGNALKFSQNVQHNISEDIFNSSNLYDNNASSIVQYNDLMTSNNPYHTFTNDNVSAINSQASNNMLSNINRSNSSNIAINNNDINVDKNIVKIADKCSDLDEDLLTIKEYLKNQDVDNTDVLESVE